MSRELICTWLELEPGEWPPDHYRLLGLRAGEDNLELIEQRVHQRLDTVRRYQMMHPEPATEAMNRLAQAFVCLTEPATKKLYDAELLGTGAPAEIAAPAPAEVPLENRDPLAWLYSPTGLAAALAAHAAPAVPPPLPTARPPAVPPPLPPLPPAAAAANAPSVADAAETTSAGADAPTAPTPVADAPGSPRRTPVADAPGSPEPVDPAVEAARSRPARRGLAGKRALYQRVAATRRLLAEWNEVGKYLSSPKRRLGRASEVKSLLAQLEEVRALLRRFPPLLGEAGQPGYLILTLSDMADVPMFQALSGQQREALSRDWKAALKLLTAHRDYLRQEIRARRRRTLGQRLARRLRYLLSDEPGTVLLLLALLALNIAIWRTWGSGLWDRLTGPPTTAPAASGKP
jgi:hypothetical protein